MKIRKYIIQTIFLMIAILLIFTFLVNRLTEPSASTEKKETTLSIGWTGNDTNFSKSIEEILAGFEVNEPSLQLTKLNLTDTLYPENDWRQLYLTNSWPDIMEVTDSNLAKDLDLIHSIPTSWTTSFSDALGTPLNPNEQLVLPLQATTDSKYLAIYYNEALFSEYDFKEPTTYDEFLDLCEQIAKTSTKPFGISGARVGPLQDLFLMYLSEYLGTHPDFYQTIQSGETDFDDTYLNLFQKIKHLIATYGIENWTAYTENGLITDFNAGKVAMIISDQRVFGQTEESPYFKIGTFLLPSEKSKQQYVIQGAFQKSWVISKAAFNDKTKQEFLRKFISFYYSDEATAIFIKNKSFPPLESYLDNDNPSFTDEHIDLLKQLFQETEPIELSLPLNEIPFLFQFFSSQTVILQKYLLNELNLQDVQTQLQSTWEFLQVKESAN